MLASLHIEEVWNKRYISTMSDLIMSSSYLILPKAADIRGARAYLGWTQKEFADRCGTSAVTVTTIEKEKSKPSKELLERMAHVFMAEDVYFHTDGGYKIEKSLVKIFDGKDGYLEAQKDMFKTCSLNKEEILFLSIDDSRSSDDVIANKKKIYEAGISCRCIISNTNNYILGPLEDYKQVDSSYFFSDNVMAIYGNKVSLAIKGDKGVKSICINYDGFANEMKKYFNHLWNIGKVVKKSSVEQVYFK